MSLPRSSHRRRLYRVCDRCQILRQMWTEPLRAPAQAVSAWPIVQRASTSSFCGYARASVKRRAKNTRLFFRTSPDPQYISVGVVAPHSVLYILVYSAHLTLYIVYIDYVHCVMEQYAVVPYYFILFIPLFLPYSLFVYFVLCNICVGVHVCTVLYYIYVYTGISIDCSVLLTRILD